MYKRDQSMKTLLS